MYLPPDPLYSRLLDNGESTLPRAGLGSGVALVSGNLYLSYFTALKTQIVNNVNLYTGVSVASGTTLCQVSVYNIDQSRAVPGTVYPGWFYALPGDLHMIANTANDTSFLVAANTKFTKALNTSWYKERGMRYALGVLWIGTAGPSLIGQGTLNSVLTGQILSEEPMVSHVVTGQTQLTVKLPFTTRAVYANSGNTTNGSTTVTISIVAGQTSAAGAFSPDDVGLGISGTNIPAGAVVTAWNSFTSVTISAAATGTGSGITFTIAAAPFSTTTQPRLNYVELT